MSNWNLVPEEAVERALLGVMGFDACQDDDAPKDDAYFVDQMRAALEAEPPEVGVTT